MALNRTVARFLAHGLAQNAIRPGGEVLELGESIIVANASFSDLIDEVQAYVPPDRVEEARRQAEAAKTNKALYQQAFGPARAFFHAVFAPSAYVAVELGLSPRRYTLDLNQTQNIGHRFDYVVNNGTSEHIFDQAKVYEFLHEVTRPGGLMIHWTPGLGFENHGLYNIQPGFVFDLAKANGYEIEVVGLTGYESYEPFSSADDFKRVLKKSPSLRNSLLCSMLRKTSDRPFCPPIQGDYQGGLAAAYQLSKAQRSYKVDGRRNLALGRPALQSSTSKYSYDEAPARDAQGGCNGFITGFYGFTTAQEAEPWWMVDLGAMMPVREVVIYNPLLAAGDLSRRSAKLRIKLSDDSVAWKTVFARTEGEAIGGADGLPLRVPLTDQAARYVRVDLPGTNVLHLDEVEVY